MPTTQKPIRRLTPTLLGLAHVIPGEQQDTVAIATLAYRERLVLRATVEEILLKFKAAGRECIVCICDDGGDDGTPELVNQLVEENPGKVVAVSHKDQFGAPFNQGYATALASALKLTVATGCEKIVTTDADGQFTAEDMIGIVKYAEAGSFDVVFGRREHRADGLKRFIVGHSWTIFTRLWTRFWGLKDADCAIKFLRADTIAQFKLSGQYGMAGAELAAWSRALKLRIGQYPVRHLPRTVGEQSGNKLKVVTGSFKSLPNVYGGLYRNGHRLAKLRRLWKPRDVGAYWVTITASVVSVAVFIWYYRHGMTLLYPDAISHLLISHRATDSPTPGLAQYGNVWLPGTHMLATPLLHIPGAFLSGIGGSVVSMMAFVVASRYLYKTVFMISGWLWAGVAAAGVFMFNPNVLYMQSTPMEEVPLYACIAASMYFAVRYGKSKSWKDAAALSLAAAIGCTIRYEGWIIALALMLYVIAVNVFPWRDMHRLQADALLYAFLPGLFFLFWIAYSAIIFGNPLQWYNGPYARPSNWVGASDVAIHNLFISAKTYWIATGDTIGQGTIVLLIAGLAIYIFRVLKHKQSVAPLILLVMPAFFIWALYQGQRPLHVMEINHELYNVRFSLVMVIPAAIFIGCSLIQLRTFSRWLKTFRIMRPTVIILAIVSPITIMWALASTPAATVQEGLVFASSQTQISSAKAALAMRKPLHGGYVLMQNYGNEVTTFRSDIPLQYVIYEGNNNNRLWQRALHDPSAMDVRLIYMRQTRGHEDEVWQALHGSATLSQYHVVYEDSDQVVYGWGPAQPSPEIKQTETLASGEATWFDAEAETCLTSLAPIGSIISVVGNIASEHINCKVTGAGPSNEGRIINLESRQFSQLASLDTGTTPITISITQ
jgi:glycosyltransferase involved in cell wall biosynthesis